MIPYQPFAEHLKSIGVLASPSELHAQASAFLCVNQNTQFDQWLHTVCEDYCIENPSDTNLKHVLSAVFDYAKEQLTKTDNSYQILLPQDEVTLGERIDILAEWVATFISALGVAGLVTELMSVEGQEFVQDLDKIARIDNSTEGLEAEELDFIEITEYVRTGVMMMFVELNASETHPKSIN